MAKGVNGVLSIFTDIKVFIKQGSCDLYNFNWTADCQMDFLIKGMFVITVN